MDHLSREPNLFPAANRRTLAEDPEFGSLHNRSVLTHSLLAGATFWPASECLLTLFPLSEQISLNTHARNDRLGS